MRTTRMTLVLIDARRGGPPRSRGVPIASRLRGRQWRSPDGRRLMRSRAPVDPRAVADRTSSMPEAATERGPAYCDGGVARACPTR